MVVVENKDKARIRIWTFEYFLKVQNIQVFN